MFELAVIKDKEYEEQKTPFYASMKTITVY